MNRGPRLKMDLLRIAGATAIAALSLGSFALAQTASTSVRPRATQETLDAEVRNSGTENSRPKLVVLLVVDQMRGDYVDKFVGQWQGGLRRLVEEGAWFHDAAYPYAGTETCVGHATISTGAFPSTHGMVANAWWDRDSGKVVTCTGDPQVKNVSYTGASVSGGDSAWRMELPSF